MDNIRLKTFNLNFGTTDPLARCTMKFVFANCLFLLTVLKTNLLYFMRKIMLKKMNLTVLFFIFGILILDGINTVIPKSRIGCRNKILISSILFPPIKITEETANLSAILGAQISFAVISLMAFFMYNKMLSEIFDADNEYYTKKSIYEKELKDGYASYNTFGRGLYPIVLWCSLSAGVMIATNILCEFLIMNYSIYAMCFKIIVFNIIAFCNIMICVARWRLLPRTTSFNENYESFDAVNFMKFLQRVNKEQIFRLKWKQIYALNIVYGYVGSFLFLGINLIAIFSFYYP